MEGLLLPLLDKVKAKLGLIDLSAGSATANTALAYHAGRILALNEGDMPYCLRLLCSGLVETLGRLTFQVRGKGGKGGERQRLESSFTAHPKLDPETGKLHFFR